MSEESKEIVEKEEGALRVSGEGQKAAGFDEVEKDDLKMPRLSILQLMSGIVEDQKGKLGQLANSITKEVYGDSVEFIALFLFKSRAQFDVGRGLVMLSLDNKFVTFGKDEFEKYAGLPVEEVPSSKDGIMAVNWDGKTPPEFNLVYNFPCILAGERVEEFPMSLSLMRTATRAAKDFISMARFANEDMFARVYTIKTKIINGEKGSYAVPEIEFSRRCTNKEYEIAREQYGYLFKKKDKIEVDLSEEPLADADANTESNLKKSDEGWTE